MITKGIIEELTSPTKARVRVPLFDKTSSSNFSTDVEELHVATICTLPNCYVNLQKGDIVFVGFEDNVYDKAVILGHLCREAEYDTLVDACFGKLTVEHSAALPENTRIGKVTSRELSYLFQVKGSIQEQLDMLSARIDTLEGK